MICPSCGKTGTIKCKEHVEIEFESSEVNPSIQYYYRRNFITCNHCNMDMIQCDNNTELELIRSVIDLGLHLEQFSRGRICSETNSINADTGALDVKVDYVNPVLSIFIPVDDPKRCINIIEKAKSINDKTKEISYNFYAEFNDFDGDHEYYSLDDILHSLHRGDVEFYCVQIDIRCRIDDEVTNIERSKAFDGFTHHCLDLMNYLKELDS